MVNVNWKLLDILLLIVSYLYVGDCKCFLLNVDGDYVGD